MSTSTGAVIGSCLNWSSIFHKAEVLSEAVMTPGLISIDNRRTLVVAVVALLFVALACGSKTPPPAQFVGVWDGTEGTLLTIRADGSGDYLSGGSKVTGGSVTIDEAAKTLKVTLASLGPTYTIDKPPAGDQMTLSGVVFRRRGGNPNTITGNLETEIPDGK